MCLEPKTFDGEKVACRGCRICRDNRLNDLVGRCIAEQNTSSSTVAVTLTYGGGDIPEATILYYRHIQLMLKRLRKDGFPVRYICAGEYGAKKGRAHWHIILFFQDRVPYYDIEDQFHMWKYWEHGFSYFQHPDYRGFRYIMKYALKNIDDPNSRNAITMSKKPPLGYSFFMQMASDLVQKKLAIHSPVYSFMHVKDKKGVARKYWLQGRMRELFLERYCDLWRITWKTEPPYTDFLYERYIDKTVEPDHQYYLNASLRDKRPLAEKQGIKAGHDALYPSPVRWLSLGHYGTCIVMSDETAQISNGGPTWQIIEKENGGRRVGDRLKALLPHDLASALYRELASEWRLSRATL